MNFFKKIRDKRLWNSIGKQQIKIFYNKKEIYTLPKISGSNLYYYSIPKQQNECSLDVYTNPKTHDLWIERDRDDEFVECDNNKIYELKSGDKLYSSFKYIND